MEIIIILRTVGVQFVVEPLHTQLFIWEFRFQIGKFVICWQNTIHGGKLSRMGGGGGGGGGINGS